MSAPYTGQKWLVYGLPESTMGIRLVLDEEVAKRYHAIGFDVREVIEEDTYHEPKPYDGRPLTLLEQKEALGPPDPVPGVYADIQFGPLNNDDRERNQPCAWGYE